MVSRAFHLKDSVLFCKQALLWASGFENACFFDSNGYADAHANLNAFLAVGSQDEFLSTAYAGNNSFGRLQAFVDANPDCWIPGFLSYDLKNETEDLQSRHPNREQFPDAYFFIPTYTLLIGKYNVEIRGENPESIIREIAAMVVKDPVPRQTPVPIQHRMDREEYGKSFRKLQDHIRRGDCYEVNLCQEFFAEDVQIDPLELYLDLNSRSKTPFSCFFKVGGKYILSASPERFLAKRGSTVLSQPIKGTARRSSDTHQDEEIKRQLAHSEKELSENYMIVDLVRNDLTRFALPGTVAVTELAKIYSFPQVHQLISTITCQVDAQLPVTEAVAKAFPPGSMTGAPKIRAMELIDEVEMSRRGVYSGVLGYFGPKGEFDFSVVIRTVIYNKSTGYLSFQAGGAITALSDEEQEYQECLLKAKPIFESLSQTN